MKKLKDSNLTPGKRRMTPQQYEFVRHYLLLGIGAAAARKAGYKNPGVMAARLLDPGRHPLVAKAVTEARAAREAKAMLKAEDLLRHIHEVIEINLARWFEPGEDGGWLIDEEGLKGLPDHVGKMIECLERRVVEDGDGGRVTTFWVKIVSKTKAMELAARHQLGERHDHTVTVVNWDDLYLRTAAPPDPLGGRRVLVTATESPAPAGGE